MVESQNLATKSRPANALKNWRALVSAEAEIAMLDRELITDAVSLHLFFYFERPKSHYAKTGALAKTAPQFMGSKPDLSKLIRAVEDSMTGIVYTDDCRISACRAFKLWVNHLDGEQEGVLIYVQEAD